MVSMMKSLSGALLCAVLGSALFAATAVPVGSQRRLAFNDGWRFFKGEAPGAEQPDFQDSSWTEVRLPHDWAIDGPFDPKLNPHTGALPIFGTGWYRKSFTLPASAKGRYISIEFDGAMYNSTVWLNGHELGGRPYMAHAFERMVQYCKQFEAELWLPTRDEIADFMLTRDNAARGCSAAE